MSRGAAARLFVAVELPASMREQLAGWGRGAVVAARAHGVPRGVLRALDEDVLHLTLCFLDSRPVGEIDALAAAVGGVRGRACRLGVGAPLWLPARRPRALAVEVHDPDGALAALQARTVATLAGICDWEPERRRYRPHVTIVRLRGGAGGTRGLTDAPLPTTPSLAFTAAAIVLFRSWLSPSGASYEPLARGVLERATG